MLPAITGYSLAMVRPPRSLPRAPLACALAKYAPRGAIPSLHAVTAGRNPSRVRRRNGAPRVRLHHGAAPALPRPHGGRLTRFSRDPLTHPTDGHRQGHRRDPAGRVVRHSHVLLDLGVCDGGCPAAPPVGGGSGAWRSSRGPQSHRSSRQRTAAPRRERPLGGGGQPRASPPLRRLVHSVPPHPTAPPPPPTPPRSPSWRPTARCRRTSRSARGRWPSPRSSSPPRRAWAPSWSASSCSRRAWPRNPGSARRRREAGGRAVLTRSGYHFVAALCACVYVPAAGASRAAPWGLRWWLWLWRQSRAPRGWACRQNAGGPNRARRAPRASCRAVTPDGARVRNR